MTYEWSLCSDKGGRAINEDRIRCFECEGATVAIVADGLGGHGDGEIAAQEVVDSIEKCFRLFPEVSVTNIQNIMEAVNRNVVELQTKTKRMKSTVVALFLAETMAVAAYAGDSRLYCLNRFRVLHKTRDHSVTQMAVELGVISEKQMKGSEDRNRVLKSVGNENCTVSVYELDAKIRKANAFLLCTDGFWEHFEERMIRRALRKGHYSAERWLDILLKQITEHFEDNQDNYSAIALVKRRRNGK